MLPPRATTICHWPSAAACAVICRSCPNRRGAHGGSWGRRLGVLGVLSKWERPLWQFLGEAAGRVGMSCLNGRDPHGSSCERRLGRVGVSCLNGRDAHGGSWGGGWEGWDVPSKRERPPQQFLGDAAGRVGVSRLNGRDPHGGSWGGGWERWASVCLCTWVASLLFLLVRPPCPGQPQGRGAEASPLMYLRVLVPVGHVSPSPAPTPAVCPREPPADPFQGLSLWPV